MTRVLVTDGEQRSALAVVRSLGRAGYQPYVCSARRRSIAGGSRYSLAEATVPDRGADLETYVGRLAELIARWKIDVLLPVTDASCLAVLSRRAQLPDVCLPLPGIEAYRAVSDKRRLLDRARGLGVAAPEQEVLEDPAELNGPLVRSLDFPVVIKPACSVVLSANGQLDRFGVSHASNAEQLLDIASSLPTEAYPLLIQRRIEGPGVGVFLLRWDGRTVAGFSHRRIREKPPSGGVSVYRESIPLDKALVEKSEAILESCGWRGVAMIEYKIDSRTGEPFLMEVNGRFWGSLQLAVDAGVDFPRLLMELAGGRTEVAPVPAYSVGVRSRWWWGDIDHVLLRLRRSKRQLGLSPADPGRLRAVLQFARLWRPGDRSEVLRLEDPSPFLRESLAWLRRQ